MQETTKRIAKVCVLGFQGPERAQILEIFRTMQRSPTVSLVPIGAQQMAEADGLLVDSDDANAVRTWMRTRGKLRECAVSLGTSPLSRETPHLAKPASAAVMVHLIRRLFAQPAPAAVAESAELAGPAPIAASSPVAQDAPARKPAIAAEPTRGVAPAPALESGMALEPALALGPEPAFDRRAAEDTGAAPAGSASSGRRPTFMPGLLATTQNLPVSATAMPSAQPDDWMDTTVVARIGPQPTPVMQTFATAPQPVAAAAVVSEPSAPAPAVAEPDDGPADMERTLPMPIVASARVDVGSGQGNGNGATARTTGAGGRPLDIDLDFTAAEVEKRMNAARAAAAAAKTASASVAPAPAPAARPAAASAQPVQRVPRNSVQLPEDSSLDRPARILVVDGRFKPKKRAPKTMKIFGHAAELAASGEEALGRLSSRSYDIVFLTPRTGEISAYELCKRLKRNPRKNGGQVFLLLDEKSLFGRMRARAAGCDACLIQPVSDIKMRYLLDQYVSTPSVVTGPGIRNSLAP